MTTPVVPGSGYRKPDLFSTNWKWAVPLVVFACIFLLASFVATIFLIVETSFQHSDCYQQALQRARADPAVTQKIGQPLKAGWLASGNINISGPSGHADISIPLSGPKGQGTLYVVSDKSAGLWSFKTLQVEVKGEGRIDLLRPQEKPPEAH